MTKTYGHGTGKRESHDSSAFYNRFAELKPEGSDDATFNLIAPESLDVIYRKSCEDMQEVPNNSVAMMVTSPPYNAGKDCDLDWDFDEYLQLLLDVMAETHRVLEPGGRAVINIANVGRSPYVPLTTYLDAICQTVGFLPRGQIIWIKGKGQSGSCAWGSWMKANNPTLRDVHEYILVYSKGRFDRVRSGESDITRDEFLEYTLSSWYMQPASAKKLKHPAPYPLELPMRALKLYTFKGDVVLDPFMGSGTTAVAASLLGRHYVGYELSQTYIDIANKRIEEGK